MTSNKKKNRLRTAIIICAVLFAIIMYALTAVLAGRTFLWWPKAVTICAMAACVVSIRGWRLLRYITGSQTYWLNFICSVILFTGVISGAFYSLNYFGADKTEVSEETVTVEAKHAEERHRSRRVGRRYVGSGEKYMVYKLDVRFPDGTVQTLDVPASRYAKVRTGAHMKVTTAPGLFGFKVRMT